jgi:hypothetical protein
LGGPLPAIGAAAGWIAPILRRGGISFAEWLVSISWGKFFLLSLLLLIFSGVAFSLLSSGSGGSGRDGRNGKIQVNVHVVPLSEGDILIQSAEQTKERSGSVHVIRNPHAPRAKASDDGVVLQIDGDGGPDSPSVRIDKQGVRILADEDGTKASVIIDNNGVRIEKLPGAGAATKGGAVPGAPPVPPAPPPVPGRPLAQAPSASPSATPAPAPAPMSVLAPGATIAGGVLVKPADLGDPEKVAEAVEAARDQIESMLQDQVDDKVAALDKSDAAERENWLALVTTMGIIALIIVKVVLGSKSKAEFQARRASAVAAQEGLKRQLAEAQLKMMQAQVEPHFLFNTLASVDYLIETDPARASRMQKNLIQYLRAALPQMREGTSNLGREILQARSYLEILKVRMDERLQFSIHVPQGLLSATFPPMMLLTLVENAIKHGLEPKPEGGSLSVSAVIADGQLRVAVADSGMGFGVAQRGGTGVGLANVRERLQALYGSAASLIIDANSDGGTIATIAVPYRIDAFAGAAGNGPMAPQPAAA